MAEHVVRTARGAVTTAQSAVDTAEPAGKTAAETALGVAKTAHARAERLLALETEVAHGSRGTDGDLFRIPDRWRDSGVF
jgi:hypothetical protein